MRSSAFKQHVASNYLVRVGGAISRLDLSHERRAFDVLVIAHDVNGVLARFGGIVFHVARPVAAVFAVDFRLRWTFYRKA